MADQLNSLFREIIMEHYKHPRNRGLKENLEVYQINNPTCGDKLVLQVELKDNIIQNIYHEGIGCSISVSSCSIMSETLQGKSIEEAIDFIHNYIRMLHGEHYTHTDMGEAIAYEGIKNYPARFKCASISWELLLNVLEMIRKEKKGE